MGNVTIVIDGRIEVLRLGGREHFVRVPSSKVLALELALVPSKVASKQASKLAS